MQALNKNKQHEETLKLWKAPGKGNGHQRRSLLLLHI